MTVYLLHGEIRRGGCRCLDERIDPTHGFGRDSAESRRVIETRNAACAEMALYEVAS